MAIASAPGGAQGRVAVWRRARRVPIFPRKFPKTGLRGLPEHNFLGSMHGCGAQPRPLERVNSLGSMRIS